MIEFLPIDEINFVKNVTLEGILNTHVDWDIAYFIELDLKYPDETQEKPNCFPF